MARFVNLAWKVDWVVVVIGFFWACCRFLIFVFIVVIGLGLDGVGLDGDGLVFGLVFVCFLGIGVVFCFGLFMVGFDVFIFFFVRYCLSVLGFFSIGLIFFMVV